jgi:hypothetical protein
LEIDAKIATVGKKTRTGKTGRFIPGDYASKNLKKTIGFSFGGCGKWSFQGG